VLALALAAAPIWAQNQGSNQGQSQSQGPALQQQSQSNIEVSDAEVKKLVTIVKKVQKMNKDLQQQWSQAIKDSKLSQKRYRELAQARRGNKQGKASDETKKETRQYNKLTEKRKQITQSANKELQEVIKSQGLTMQRYQKLVRALRTDQELAKRVQKQL
jgi:hypothetical protein